MENASLAVVRGNLAPNGAVIKTAAATPALMQHRGRAVVFENYTDMLEGINTPDLPVDAESVLVLKNAGPKIGRAFPRRALDNRAIAAAHRVGNDIPLRKLSTPTMDGCSPSWGAKPVVHLPLKCGDNLRWLGDVATITRLDDPRVECRSHPHECVAMSRIVGIGEALDLVRIQLSVEKELIGKRLYQIRGRSFQLSVGKQLSH